LAGFDAQVDGDAVRLTWQTATETNNAGFRVERRVGEGERGGVGAWTRVGFVDGAGTTSKAQTYRFTDAELPFAADTLRYRLKSVDTNGSEATTETVTVLRSAVEELRLLGTYPNPARSRATVRFAVPEGAGEDVTLRLYDVLGRQVRTVRAGAKPGRHTLRLETAGLSSGVYVLRLAAGGAVKTRKLTVVR
jgi:hypothetical protein